MKTTKSNQQGFAHHLVIMIVAVVVVIGGVFAAVVRAHHKKAHNSSTSSSSTNSTTKLSSNSPTEPTEASAGSSGNTSSNSATSTSKPSTSAGSSSSSSSGGINASQPAPSASSAPTTQDLINALTGVISGLKSGQQVTVTAANVTVAGPVSDAQARPIVFSYGGQSYFAYTQSYAADYTASASQVANTMAITKTSGSYALVYAHLDKSANLVDPDFNVVGYSH